MLFLLMLAIILNFEAVSVYGNPPASRLHGSEYDEFNTIPVNQYIDALMKLDDDLLRAEIKINPIPVKRTKLQWVNHAVVSMRADTRNVITEYASTLAGIVPDLKAPVKLKDAEYLAGIAIKKWRFFYFSKDDAGWLARSDPQPEIAAGLGKAADNRDPSATLTRAQFEKLKEHLAKKARFRKYIKINAGKTVKLDNGDGTSSHFVLDPSTPKNKAVLLCPDAYLAIYAESDKNMRETEEKNYRKPDRDVIVLLHWVEIDRFYPTNSYDGNPAQFLTLPLALANAGNFFPPPENNSTGKSAGWYQWWGYDATYCMISYRVKQMGADITSHELAHRMTNLSQVKEETDRERIADGVAAIVAKDKISYVVHCLDVK